MPCLQAMSMLPSIWGNIISINESPNEYSFMDQDLGLTTEECNFDQYNFYYDLEELQKPADCSMMDDDSISDMQSPTSQRWICFLCNTPAQCNDKMSTTYPDLVAYATDFVAELLAVYNSQHKIVGRN